MCYGAVHVKAQSCHWQVVVFVQWLGMPTHQRATDSTIVIPMTIFPLAMPFRQGYQNRGQLLGRLLDKCRYPE